MNKVSYAILSILVLLVFSACNQSTPTPTPSPTTEVESSTLNTRSTQQRIEAAAYHYKTIAAFRDGQAEHLADLATLQGKQISFVVLYHAMAPWAEVFNTGQYTQTGDDHLNGLMESYDLDIVKQFAIDDENEGLVLEPNTAIENPIEAAKELSLVEHVLMVEVKEVPSTSVESSTADVH